VHVSTVLAIQTKGRAGSGQWVESFRLEYSQDSATFNSIMDANGNNHVRNILVSLHINQLLACNVI